jgi:hypothetical protein
MAGRPTGAPGIRPATAVEAATAVATAELAPSMPITLNPSAQTRRRALAVNPLGAGGRYSLRRLKEAGTALLASVRRLLLI